MQRGATMTLREGLEEYYGTIDNLITEDNSGKEIVALFRFHDTCHVLFGCDTRVRHPGRGVATPTDRSARWRVFAAWMQPAPRFIVMARDCGTEARVAPPNWVASMRRARCIFALLLVAACSVDAGDPFAGVMSGSASATATSTASASGSATDSSSGPGSETANAPTDGDETSGPGTGPEESTGNAVTGTETTALSGETQPTSSTSTATDATTMGSSSESSGSTGSDSELCGGAALDGELDIPPGCDATCTSIGYGGPGCPGSQICRLADTTTGVCEGCVACGNLHAPCAATIDCDILFTCFLGQCTAMCDFNTPQTCGNPAACTNVGHPTHGVCDPNL